MGIFSRYNPTNRIYLVPLEAVEGEELPTDKTKILFCDAEGVLTTAIIDTSLFEIVESYIAEAQKTSKFVAVVCLEVEKGRSVSFPVEVNAEQASSLVTITRWALESAIIPQPFKKYAKQIIKLGEKTLKERQKQVAPELIALEATPELMEHIEKGAEIELIEPASKKDYTYPAILLGRLPPNEQTRPEMQRIMILDSDGDAGIVRIPLDVIDDIEKDLEQWCKDNEASACIVFAQKDEGLNMGVMPIRDKQKRELDTLGQQIVKRASTPKPLSQEIEAVLAKAKSTFPL